MTTNKSIKQRVSILFVCVITPFSSDFYMRFVRFASISLYAATRFLFIFIFIFIYDFTNLSTKKIYVYILNEMSEIRLDKYTWNDAAQLFYCFNKGKSKFFYFFVLPIIPFAFFK